MATFGPLTFQHIRPVADRGIDLDNVQANLKPLAHLLNEMGQRVDTVEKHFDALAAIALASKDMIYESWNYRPLSNLVRSATQWYLTEEQYQGMFKDAAIHQNASKVLKQEFTDATADLKQNPSEQNFANALENLILVLDSLMGMYLDAIQNASDLPTQFNQLPQKLQQTLDQFLTHRGLDTLGGIQGLSIVGAQHTARIPLILKELAKTAKKSEIDAISSKGQRIEEIIDAKVNPILINKFASRS